MSAIYYYEPLSELLLLNVHNDNLYFIYTQLKKHFSPYRYAKDIITLIRSLNIHMHWKQK